MPLLGAFDASRNNAAIIKFPQRRQLAIVVAHEGSAWLIVRDQHGWIFGDRQDAFAEAHEIARMDSVSIVVRHGC